MSFRGPPRRTEDQLADIYEKLRRLESTVSAVPSSVIGSAAPSTTTPIPPLVLMGDSKTVQYSAFYRSLYPNEAVEVGGGNSQDPLTYPWAGELARIGKARVIVLQDYPNSGPAGTPPTVEPAQDTAPWRAAWTDLVVKASALAPRVIVLVDTVPPLDASTQTFFRGLVGAAPHVEYLDMIPPDLWDGVHFDYAGAVAMATAVHDRIYP